MSQTSFQGLFNAALQDYENQTGTSLINHPFSEQLEACDSVDSITTILQEQAQIFRKFKGDDGKLMKSLNCSVDVLYTLSTTILGEGIGVVSLEDIHQCSLLLTVVLRHSLPRKQYSLESLSYSP